jgi:excinuclease ABC subunit C
MDLIKKYLSQKAGKSINILIPEKGDQFQLVNMCKNNAYEYLLRSKEYKTRQEDVLEDIKNILSLSKNPNYIEAYDISNLRNSNNVGAMIVFKDARPLKKAYRKFKIQSVYGQDDYGSMKEMLTRRFENYYKNKEDEAFSVLPDLILIDGGQNHTTAAKEIIQKFNLNIPVFGMVKDSKHRTRAITTDGNEIEIKSNSRVFGFITRVQDEVHRFAISYHRKLRGKSVKTSELTKIEGIGKTKANTLLRVFGSIDGIKNASESKLLKTKGITRKNVENIKKYFMLDQIT